MFLCSLSRVECLVCVCVVIGSSDLVTTQAGSTDRRGFGWDRHFDFITRTVQSLNGPGARGRVTCLVNDNVSEAEKVSGELKGHGWDCYHCKSSEPKEAITVSSSSYSKENKENRKPKQQRLECCKKIISLNNKFRIQR
ncbi:hypothetical protein PoB_001533600 [Plakobranchus ocellatus]|uniref:Uncharacterized protein n=1 Tax=Plakobranchus ocellatus TaxID=259542 RepID=A0AAV3YZ47_9GAST|nr:hypothetical protein PoB_001533600 [Plakobranchus ocellatus]